MARRSAVLIGFIALSLLLSACGLFGSKKKDGNGIPDDANVLGFVYWIDGFPAQGIKVELDNKTVTTNQDGLFGFSNVNAGTYTLRVYRNGDVEDEMPIIVDDDIILSDIAFEIGENEFQWGSLEEYPIGEAVPPSGESSAPWSANRQLGGPASEVDVVDDVARTGSKSIRVKGVTETIIEDGEEKTLVSLATVRQWGRNLEIGGTYRLTAWFKTDPPVSGVPPLDDPPVYMRIRFCDTSCEVEIRGQYDELFYAPAAKYLEDVGPAFVRVHPESYDDEWNRLYVEFKMPAQSDRLLVEYSSRANWNNGEPTTVWWDDSSLVRID